MYLTTVVPYSNLANKKITEGMKIDSDYNKNRMNQTTTRLFPCFQLHPNANCCNCTTEKINGVQNCHTSGQQEKSIVTISVVQVLE